MQGWARYTFEVNLILSGRGVDLDDSLRQYATEADFSRVEVAPIEDDLWRFYLLAE